MLENISTRSFRASQRSAASSNDNSRLSTYNKERRSRVYCPVVRETNPLPRSPPLRGVPFEYERLYNRETYPLLSILRFVLEDILYVLLWSTMPAREAFSTPRPLLDIELAVECVAHRQS